jgi:hypothetical protein
LVHKEIISSLPQRYAYKKIPKHFTSGSFGVAKVLEGLPNFVRGLAVEACPLNILVR